MKNILRGRLLSRLIRKSYSLNKLDMKLLPYLNFRNGLFVEVGANDGISQSNTLFFEKCMGWRGLLIEAIPSLFTKCQQNRPKCNVINCALVGSDYPDKTVEMRYCNLMSLVKGGLKNEEDEQRHIQRGKQFLVKGEETYIVKVPAKTLSDLLCEQHIDHVDFLSLDVEGYEPEVLKGIDFGRHRIEFMLIEVRDREKVEAVIRDFYKPIAILNLAEGSYSDILYSRK